MKFASKDLTIGQINAIVKKLGGHDMAMRFLRDELEVSKIPSVTSNGMFGKDWLNYFWSRKRNDPEWKEEESVSKWAIDVITKPEFNNSVTKDVTYHPVLIRGDEFSIVDRNPPSIRNEAEKRGYITPPPELLPLLWHAMSDESIKALGLHYLVVMHKGITTSNGYSSLLCLERKDNGHYWLNATNDIFDHNFPKSHGFIFLASQVSES